MGRLKRVCKDACRLAGAIRQTHEPEMFAGQGADFAESDLEPQILRFARMILHSTSYDLASLFRGRRGAFGT